MTVFADLLQTFSSCSLADLERQAREMPLYLLERAWHTSPILRRQRGRVQRIVDEIAARVVERRLWRDADLYYPIFTTMETMDDEERTEQLLRRLEIHLGMRPLEELRAFAAPMHRLLSLTGRVWRTDAGRVRPLERDVFTRIDESAATVYLPEPGLFLDIVPESRYPTRPVDAEAREGLDRLRDAWSLLRAVDPETARDFDDCISTIVLLPPAAAGGAVDRHRARWSYNLRLRYFGGVFLDVSGGDRYSAAEGLVHEHLHQRLWHWWEIECPDGLPERHVVVRSPMTGMERPAYVMVHALAVYVAVHELYLAIRGAADYAPAPDGWVESRLDRLSAVVPQLHDVLCDIVRPRTTVRKLLDVLLARFASSAPPITSGEPVMDSPECTEKPCGILLHQRPWLHDVFRLDDPRAFLVLETWFNTPDEDITDRSLAEATTRLDGKNLLFLKALVDGRPEVINVELDGDRLLTAAELLAAPPTICVHETNDPASGFHLRTDIRDVKILAPIRGWILRSHTDPATVGVPALQADPAQ